MLWGNEWNITRIKVFEPDAVSSKEANASVHISLSHCNKHDSAGGLTLAFLDKIDWSKMNKLCSMYIAFYVEFKLV